MTFGNVFGGNSGGGASSIPTDQYFANNIDRDDFFTTSPSRLKKNAYCSVSGELQKYDGDSWIAVAEIHRGAPGQSAPAMIVQYSATGTSGWTTTLNTALHKYWRWSTDNGATWSADGVKYSADGAGLTPEQEQDLTDNTAARHTHANQAIIDATTGTFTMARQNKLDGVQDTFRGTFANEAAINAALPAPTDGWAAWNTETATVWSALGGVWADTLATSVGDMLKATYDPQGIADDAFDRANHTGAQAIATVTGLQAELNKIPVMQGEIDALELRLDDPETGLVKAIIDLDTQVNEAGNGLVDRLTDLEQGGTTTTKLRTHSISGKYEDGELVQRARNFGGGTVMCIYRANGAIDGSNGAVAFVEGTEPGTWTELSPGGADFGDVKHGYQKYDHGGWWIMNGRSVSTLPAKAQQAAYLLGLGSIIPDMRNKTVFGSMNESGLGDTAGSNTISRNNLPNVGLAFSGTSASNNRGHTHKIDPPETKSTNQNQNHSHRIPSLSGYAASADAAPSGREVPTTTGFWGDDYGSNLGGSSRAFSWTSTSNTLGSSSLLHNHSVTTTSSTTGANSGNHWHKVNIAEFPSAVESQNHTHTYSGATETMSGGATQVPFMQAHLRLNYFIYLGV